MLTGGGLRKGLSPATLYPLGMSALQYGGVIAVHTSITDLPRLKLAQSHLMAAV